jgi:hypothetical protein
VFDRQYWVRDDGKGGQAVKARCGAEVGLQLASRSSGAPLPLPPGVSLRLYVVNGQGSGLPTATDAAGGLYMGGACRAGRAVPCRAGVGGVCHAATAAPAPPTPTLPRRPLLPPPCLITAARRRPCAVCCCWRH